MYSRWTKLQTDGNLCPCIIPCFPKYSFYCKRANLAENYMAYFKAPGFGPGATWGSPTLHILHSLLHENNYSSVTVASLALVATWDVVRQQAWNWFRLEDLATMFLVSCRAAQLKAKNLAELEVGCMMSLMYAGCCWCAVAKGVCTVAAFPYG